jgi:hypothetical protein
MVEWELLGGLEKADAEDLATTSGCPENSGGLPVLRPFSRAEAAMLLQAGLISAADMDPPPRLADDIEAEGSATPSKTSGGAGGTGAPSKALRSAAPAHAQDADRAISARTISDLNASIVTGAAVKAHREWLDDEHPRTTKLLRLGLGGPVLMDRRSIVAVASFGYFLEGQKKAMSILRKSIDLTVRRAEGAAPWLTSFQAEMQPGVLDKALAAAIAAGKLRVSQSPWQMLYGGFGQASATMALLAITFTPVVTRHGKDLIDGVRAQSFKRPGGHVDAGTPARWIERAMADAARDSMPISYDKIVRVILSRLASAALAKVLTGSPAAWDAQLAGALTLNRYVGSGVFKEAHFDELLGAINRVADGQDVEAGLVSAALRADESAAEASVSMVARSMPQANSAGCSEAQLNALEDQEGEPGGFIGAVGTPVPMPPCTFCAQQIKVHGS